jgi:GNAT superfamily N-acetyltransferase
MDVTVHPLTPERWPDLEAVFAARGCSVARGCWCMYYRITGKGAYTRPSEAQRALSHDALKALAAQNPPPGLIGYSGATPVGWVSLGPREHYAKLRNSPAMKAVDDAPAWSIVCLVVPSEYRRRGVARALLRGAVSYARSRGVQLVEAYPVDKGESGAPDAPWFGSLAMFEELGFVEVVRRRPARPVVRLRLLED